MPCVCQALPASQSARSNKGELIHATHPRPLRATSRCPRPRRGIRRAGHLGGIGLGRAGRDRLVAHPDQRARRVELAGHGRRLHGRAPERHDQHHGDGERGVQGGAADQRAGRRRPRPVPVVGRRRAARPGRSRRRAGHHRGIAPSTSTPSARGRPDCSTSTACSTGCRTTRASSACGTTRTCSPQAGIDAPPATWAELLEDVQTLEGRRHHADRRRRRRQVAGALLVLVPDGPPRRCRRDEPDRRRQQLQRPRRRRGR